MNYETRSLSPQTHPSRAYTMHALFRATEGAPSDAPKSEAEFYINVDGSVWISDWDALAEWRACFGPMHKNAGMLTLLFAARGHIREVDAEERERIALSAGENLPGQPLVGATP